MVLTDYGLALGKLERFREGHRRLNEAHGVLSKSESVATSVLAGIIELRKAEITLVEARFLWAAASDPATNFADDKFRYYELPMATFYLARSTPQRFQCLAQARCDDAWMRLENARTHLTGRTHSAHWWQLVYALEIECIAVNGEFNSKSLSAVLSKRVRDTQHYLTRLLVKALAMADPSDHYNRLRTIEAFNHAFNVLGLTSDPTARNELGRIENEINPAANSFISAYFAQVNNA